MVHFQPSSFSSEGGLGPGLSETQTELASSSCLLAFLPPKASLEWLWVPEVVLYIIQAPLLPGHYTSRHVPHWVQQTANLLDTLDRPTGPAAVFQHVTELYHPTDY